jgi:hypothetical protein
MAMICSLLCCSPTFDCVRVFQVAVHMSLKHKREELLNAKRLALETISVLQKPNVTSGEKRKIEKAVDTYCDLLLVVENEERKHTALLSAKRARTTVPSQFAADTATAVAAVENQHSSLTPPLAPADCSEK